MVIRPTFANQAVCLKALEGFWYNGELVSNSEPCMADAVVMHSLAVGEDETAPPIIISWCEDGHVMTKVAEDTYQLSETMVWNQ